MQSPAKHALGLAAVLLMAVLLSGCGGRLPQSHTQTLGYLMDNKVGTATITQKQEPYEGKPAIKSDDEMNLKIEAGPMTITIVNKQTTRYTRDGKMLSSEQTYSQSLPETSGSSKITYTADGAKYALTIEGKTTKGKSAIPAGAKPHQVLFGWGSHAPLKVGATSTGKDFDPVERKWFDVTERVESTEKLQFEGKTVKTFVVSTTTEGKSGTKIWITKDHDLVKAAIDLSGGVTLYLRPDVAKKTSG